jgi:hypothetical protein
MRFQKRIKLLPGLKINLSKSGLSASLGPKGLTRNIKPGRKSRITIGAPGTGLSESFTHKETDDKPATRGQVIVIGLVTCAILFMYVKFFT